MTIEAHRRELSTLSIHRNGDCLLKKHPTNITNMLSMKYSSILMISVDFYNFYIIKLVKTTSSTLFYCLNSCKERLEKKWRAIRIQRHRQHWGQSEYRDTGNIEGNQNTETQLTLRAIRIQTQETLGTIRIERHRHHWGQSEYTDTCTIEGNQNTETRATLRAIRIQRHRQHWGQSEYRDTGNTGHNQNTETQVTLDTIRIQRHR